MNLLDEFVVRIGLDPRGFEEGGRKAERSFDRTKDAARRTGSAIEEEGKHGAEFFQGLQREALRFFAIIAGGRGLEQFASHVVHTGAAIGRLSRNIGESVPNISTWRNLVQSVGGTAEEATGFLVTLNDAVAGLKVGNVTPMIGDLRAISAAGGTPIDVNKSQNEIIFAIAENLKKIHLENPQLAGLLGRRIGVTGGLFDLLVRGGAPVNALFQQMQKFASINEEDAKAAQAFETALSKVYVQAEALGGKLLTTLNPQLERFLKNVSNAKSDPKGQVEREGAGVLSGLSGFSASVGNLLKSAGVSSSVVDSLFFTDAEVQRAREKVFPELFGKGSTATPAGAAATGRFRSQKEKENFIRSEAARRGIDPNVAMAVARSEGFDRYVGDRGTSFGAFQLHYKNNIPGLSNAGLGDEFTRRTGLDARNPDTERDQIRFALDEAKRSGWSPWHGWKGAPFAGIGQTSASGGGDVNIKVDNVTVTAKTDDPGQFARDFKAELLKKSSIAITANGGMQ